jgi:hypothetical protein
MRRPEAVCAEYDRPAGVTFSFQVCRYSIEPTLANRARNLFAKYNARAALADEIEEDGPEVPGIGLGESFPRRGERLAGA